MGRPLVEFRQGPLTAIPRTSGTIVTDGDDPNATDEVEELARINASDGDKLTVRAGTHIQEIYVDGEAPAFSEVSPADGARFKDAALRLGFEVRDDGAGLRHDGENVISNDLDAVLHDAANGGNNMPGRRWRRTTASPTASRSPTGMAGRLTSTSPSTSLSRLGC